MKRKRVLVIGERKSGKEVVADWLNGTVKRYHDNEVIYRENTIQIPSSYLENSWMYKNIITVAQDASSVLLVIDAKETKTRYSPGFATIFTKSVICVVTHCETEDEKLRVLKEVERIGIKTVPLYINLDEVADQEKLQNWYADVYAK